MSESLLPSPHPPQWLKLNTIFLGILLVIALCVVLKSLQGILMPFAIALFLVFMVEPLNKLLQNKFKLPVGIRVCIILTVSALLLFLIGQLIYSSAYSLKDNLPQYERRLLTMMDQTVRQLAIPSADVEIFIETFKWSDHLKAGTVARMLGQGFGNFLEFMANLFMILLYMVYLLFERETFMKRVNNSFDTEKSERIMPILQHINKQIAGYLQIKTGVSFLTGTLVTVILMICGVDFALFWGILTFLLNFIPSVGSIIATIPPALVAFLQFETLTLPFVILVALLSIQMVIGNVVEPKLMGASLGVSPLIVILSLIFWGWLWGPVGMILSVPIVSTFRIVCDNIEMLRPLSRLLAEKA